MKVGTKADRAKADGAKADRMKSDRTNSDCGRRGFTHEGRSGAGKDGYRGSGRHTENFAAGRLNRNYPEQRSTDYKPAAASGSDGEKDSLQIEGRNPVIEAFRAGKTIDRLYVQEGLKDGPVMTILREASRQDTIVERVPKERLDQITETGSHQGVIAKAAACPYASVEDILKKAEEKGEDPFLILLDDIEDPHNLGAIIRTANLCGAHGVIIPKRRAVGLTATAAKASAGAIHYTPVARVTNLVQTMEELKKRGIWFVCADMGGEIMYRQNLTGPIGLVIGNEGSGVSRLVKEKCDFTASIPMKGDIDSLNASVAAGILAYEIVRQRIQRSEKSN